MPENKEYSGGYRNYPKDNQQKYICILLDEADHIMKAKPYQNLLPSFLAV